MTVEVPITETWCPSCKVTTGRCVSPTGKPIAIHAARIRKNRAEHYGPTPYDVVYLDGQKYRVKEVEVAAAVVTLRRGTGKATWTVQRDELDFDAIAGMWRQK